MNTATCSTDWLGPAWTVKAEGADRVRLGASEDVRHAAIVVAHVDRTGKAGNGGGAPGRELRVARGGERAAQWIEEGTDRGEAAWRTETQEDKSGEDQPGEECADRPQDHG